MTGKFVDGHAVADVWKNRSRLEGVPKGFFGNAPLTTLARSTLCILSARETHGHNANSFGGWLLEAGYEIAWDLVTQDEMLTASVASFHRGSSEAFATILNKIIRPVR